MNLKNLKSKLLMMIPVLGLITSNPASAQEVDPEQADTLQSTVARLYQDMENLKKLKITGYLQAQAQFADSTGTGVGTYAAGDFSKNIDKRFMVRRGRLKATWTNTFSQYVIQVDANESGAVTLKDAYFKFTDHKIQFFTLTGGVFNRPFGYEIAYSSSDRESPERARFNQILFPNERDMGFMLTVQAPKTHPMNWLKFDIGLFNGTGVNAREFDKQKDVIGRLSMNRASKDERMKFGLGASFYAGAWRNDNDSIYNFKSGAFVLDTHDSTVNVNGVDTTYIKLTKNGNEYQKRNYIGFDAQYSIDWKIGITTIRAEYIMGTQPGISNDDKSPSAAVTKPVYIRKFNGAYFYFLQNIGQTKAQVVVKYDWFDPNTEVEGKNIGDASKAKGTTLADVKFSTLGVGAIWRFDQNLKIMAYYDMVKNEETSLTGYTSDIKDNIFTVRLQYRF